MNNKNEYGMVAGVNNDDDDEGPHTGTAQTFYPGDEEEDGEKSPLHRSFDAHDNNNNDDHSGKNHRSMTTAPSSASSSSFAQPNRTKTSVLFDSDDDSDDEDEYEVHLKRYALDFGQSSMSTTTHSSGSTSHHHKNMYHMFWSKLQLIRQKARQRRAEYLLRQSDRHSWRQSWYLCIVTTLCDESDCGIALIVIGMIVWFGMIWKIPIHRSKILAGGILVWSIRFGLRPAQQYWIRQRVRRHQRQHEEEQQRRQYEDQEYPPSTQNQHRRHPHDPHFYYSPGGGGGGSSVPSRLESRKNNSSNNTNALYSLSPSSQIVHRPSSSSSSTMMELSTISDGSTPTRTAGGGTSSGIGVDGTSSIPGNMNDLEMLPSTSVVIPHSLI